MNGANKPRRGHALRRRCPLCKILRKFCEPDGNHGGERHPRRPPWILSPFGWCCGWCTFRLRFGLSDAQIRSGAWRGALAAARDEEKVVVS